MRCAGRQRQLQSFSDHATVLLASEQRGHLPAQFLPAVLATMLAGLGPAQQESLWTLPAEPGGNVPTTKLVKGGHWGPFLELPTMPRI